MKPVYNIHDMPGVGGVCEQGEVNGQKTGHIVCRKGKPVKPDGEPIIIHCEGYWRYFGDFTQHPYSDSVRPPNES